MKKQRTITIKRSDFFQLLRYCDSELVIKRIFAENIDQVQKKLNFSDYYDFQEYLKDLLPPEMVAEFLSGVPKEVT